MEKIDLLAIALCIIIVIFAGYIAYLKAGINFILENLAKYQVAMNELLEVMHRQVNINDAQGEINKIIFDKLKINYNINLDDPSTGCQK